MGELIHHFIFRRAGIGDVIRRRMKECEAETARAKAIEINPQSSITAA